MPSPGLLQPVRTDRIGPAKQPALLIEQPWCIKHYHAAIYYWTGNEQTPVDDCVLRQTALRQPVGRRRPADWAWL